MGRHAWTHVYLTQDGEEKYFGFFNNDKEAKVWIAKQKDPTIYRIGDNPQGGRR